MRYVLGGIDRVRDGYAAIVRRLVRVAMHRRRRRRRRPGGIGVSVRQDAAELPARGGSGRAFSPPCDCRRAPRSIGPKRSSSRSENIIRPIPGVEGVLSVVGFDFIDGLAASNQAFFVIRLKPYEQRTDPSQSVGAIIQKLRPELAAMQQAIVFPFNLPPDPRPRQHRRVPICARGACKASRRPTSPRRCAACWSRPTSSRNSPACSAPSPPTRRRSISTSTATRRRCSASRSATSSTRCNRRSAVSTSTTSTFSAAPGKSMSRPRRRFANRSTTSSNIYVRNAAGADGADARAGAAAPRARSAAARALQRLSRRHHQRRAEARLQLGPGARRDGAHLGDDPARRLQLRMDRHRAPGEGGGRRRVPSCSGSRSSSPISSSWPSTRAGTFRFPVLLSVSVGVLGAIAAVVFSRAQLRRLFRRSGSWC